MHKRWFVSKTNPEYVAYLSRSASISEIIARVLINRGIKTPSAVADFLQTGSAAVSDPFDLPNMRPAVERIKFALNNGERVLVHGDYDCDGLTATAIMVHALRKAGLDAHYYIPLRGTDGYGLNSGGVREAERLGATLIVSVDCGISSFEAVRLASHKGIDVVITDHHEPQWSRTGEGPERCVLPDAVAVVNPKIHPDSGLAILAGAGVAFKLVQALAADNDFPLSEDDASSLIDLVALGTLADVVPLTGENRLMVREGLRRISGPCRPALRALKEVGGLKGREIKAGSLSYSVIPRINAAGRIGGAGDVVRLLLSEHSEEAMSLSNWLSAMNSERQKIEEHVYREARSRLSTAQDFAIVLAGEGWHQGVLGIVAARIAEETHRPAFILSTDGNAARGSARSIPSVDICKALSQCRDLLVSFGGHKQAAGVILESARLDEFRRRLSGIIRAGLDETGLIPTIEIDADIGLSEVTHSLVQEMSLLEPFGHGNAEPLFGTKGLDVLEHRRVGTDHLKLRLRKDSAPYDAIGFSLGSIYYDLKSPSTIDAVFTPGINEWNGARRLQLVVKALRPSQ